MKPLTTSEKQDLSCLRTLLKELDTLYHAGALDVYEQTWQAIAQRIQHMLPGFTLAYAEIFNADVDRYPHGGMRHVLTPQEGGAA